MTVATDIDRLARAWIDMHLHPDDDAETTWAYDRLADLCDTNPITAWEAVNAIRAMDGSDRILANLAAGPVEVLLAKHGAILVDDVVQIARQDQQLQRILGAVWRNSISDEVWRRVREVASRPW